MKKTAWVSFTAVLLALSMFTTSCSSSSSSSPTSATTAISGSIVAAPVSGAAVVVANAGGSVIAGTVNTASDGTYSVNVPTSYCNADLRIEATGGTYTDEATGTTTTAGSLAAYVPAGSMTTWSSVNITAASTIIHDMVTAGTMTFGEAQTIFNTAFGFTPDITVASKNTSAAGASVAERLAALHDAAFSQLTYDLGLTPDKQSDLLAAIAQDLADDGLLNGSTGTVNGTRLPVDIQNKFENALVSMLSNTVSNMTGLTPDLIGALPFGKVALTNTYRVQYLPGAMAATQGKTTFKIQITNISDGSAATGLMVSLMPMMSMASMSHSSPVDMVTEEGSTGVYDCAVYYLMGDGPGIGYWTLQVMIGGGMGMDETATFYPAVSMAMGPDTPYTKLYGPDDIVSSMSGTQTNDYFLFMDGAVSAATPTIPLFIAHSENMFMNFEPVSIGAVLSNPTGTVTSMTVQASTNSTFATSVTGADMGNGHWSLSGLTGLVSGQTATIYVKLNVNGQNKTTDGKAASGSNAYATFLVTPGM
ncbi:MAG TPA: hypothetical protein VL087_07260 [Nitrospirota bacterium]|nr:hypothetical protein [Nitrospirota bacterium]